MPQTAIRKPISNFFIIKPLQMRLIFKIVVAVIISTLVCSGTLLITYLIKYQSTAFYRVILDHNMDIPPRENIIFIILPSLIISAIVNIIVAFFIGAYASRKYAVPIYKLEQWADLLKDGKLTAKLRFREKEEFKELSSHCNELGDNLRSKFLEIKTTAESLKESTGENEALEHIESILESLELETKPIEVHTSFHRIAPKPPSGNESSTAEDG
ncbi:MAG: hypothetical protein GF350_03990, partial [Chitinivibrionales bacterium]|nr:hypothetical protein [Chitinivibrionales bacterium]